MAVQGMVVWVTGAGSGIGRATALAFAKAGARVALTGRRADALAETAEAIGPDAFVAVADLADPAAITRAHAAVVAALGAVDILVNNAGSNTPGRHWQQLGLDGVASVLDVNLRGPFLCSMAVLPGMRAKGGGTLIHIGSVAGVALFGPSGPAYGASKAGGEHDERPHQRRGGHPWHPVDLHQPGRGGHGHPRPPAEPAHGVRAGLDAAGRGRRGGRAVRRQPAAAGHYHGSHDPADGQPSLAQLRPLHRTPTVKRRAIMSGPETISVPVLTLQAFGAAIFAAAGTSKEEGERIAYHLVGANLAGHDSHGVIRLPRYVQWLQSGAVLPGRSLDIVVESATHAVVDGGFGFGQTIGPLAVDLGIGKAQAAGLCVIALRNSGHIGRIGDWAERAAAAGLVSLHFVNVAQGELVAPFGGVDRRFSTNPMCIGAPQPGTDPLILDFATSVVAEGKVLVASNGGKPLPEGALINPDGSLSNNPETLYGPLAGTSMRDPAQGPGALRAFGDHKGSGIAFMCEILAGCLTGGATSGPIPGGKRGQIANGMLSIYLDPAHFAGAGFAAAAREYALYFKASRPAVPGGEVLTPGEPESRTRAVRQKTGIPLQADTWSAIVQTASQLGLSTPIF